MTKIKDYGNCQESTSASTVPSAGTGSGSNAGDGSELCGGSGFSTAGAASRSATTPVVVDKHWHCIAKLTAVPEYR